MERKGPGRVMRRDFFIQLFEASHRYKNSPLSYYHSDITVIKAMC
jgi:hypothetical protein